MGGAVRRRPEAARATARRWPSPLAVKWPLRQMSASIVRQQIRCPFREGLHYRPAAAFVQRAKQFACAVRVHKDDQVVDGKSITELLTLAAEQGDSLTLEAEGHDAAPAIDALTQLLQQDWDHDSSHAPDR